MKWLLNQLNFPWNSDWAPIYCNSVVFHSSGEREEKNVLHIGKVWGNVLVVKQNIMKESGYDKLGQITSRAKSAACSKGHESPWFWFYFLLQEKSNKYNTYQMRERSSNNEKQRVSLTSPHLDGLKSCGFS